MPLVGVCVAGASFPVAPTHQSLQSEVAVAKTMRAHWSSAHIFETAPCFMRLGNCVAFVCVVWLLWYLCALVWHLFIQLIAYIGYSFHSSVVNGIRRSILVFSVTSYHLVITLGIGDTLDYSVVARGLGGCCETPKVLQGSFQPALAGPAGNRLSLIASSGDLPSPGRP